MTINHLGYLGANEIAALIRQRKLSPVEVITDILEWIERVEPRINAFAHFAPEEALRSARRAEELILRGDPLPPPSRRSRHDQRPRGRSGYANSIGLDVDEGHGSGARQSTRDTPEKCGCDRLRKNNHIRIRVEGGEPKSASRNYA